MRLIPDTRWWMSLCYEAKKLVPAETRRRLLLPSRELFRLFELELEKEAGKMLHSKRCCSRVSNVDVKKNKKEAPSGAGEGERGIIGRV